jgi:transcription elongation GreA/GreB family factor
MLDELKNKLGAEIERLTHELQVVLPRAIQKAVEHGDLRENSEYKSALEQQQFVQARLNHLTTRYGELSKIDLSEIPEDRIGFGSRVTVVDLRTREVLWTGQTRRIVSTQLHLDQTVSCSVNGLDIVGYEGNLSLTERPAFTGKRKIRHLGYGIDPTVTITQRSPGPLTVLGLVQEVSI